MKPWLRIFLVLALAATFARGAVVPGVGFEQRVGESLPLNAGFRDTEGRVQPLGAWLRGMPTVLWFGYARCPQLCGVVADGMVSVLRPLQASAGTDFDVIMLSIDPAEAIDLARANRAEALGHYGRQSAAKGWHYLTGGEAAIRVTAEAAGFHFVYDAKSGQYAHPSGFLVLTPRGQISAYFPGVDFAPKEVAAALVRARDGGIGQKVADFLLVCFRGDGIGGRYGLIIWRTLGAAVALTVLALAGGIATMLRTERKTLRMRKGQGT
jgi:protein SCO1/2